MPCPLTVCAISRLGELELVAVDDGDEPIEPEPRRAERGLPHRALLELPVAEDHERPAVAARESRGEREAGAEGETVAERARRQLHSGHPSHRVAGEPAPRPRVEGELLDREEAPLRERGVQRGHAVSLAQEQDVALRVVRPVRVDPEHLEVEGGQELDDRHRPPEMRSFRAGAHVDHVLPDPGRQRLQRHDALAICATTSRLSQTLAKPSAQHCRKAPASGFRCRSWSVSESSITASAFGHGPSGGVSSRWKTSWRGSGVSWYCDIGTPSARRSLRSTFRNAARPTPSSPAASGWKRKRRMCQTCLEPGRDIGTWIPGSSASRSRKEWMFAWRRFSYASKRSSCDVANAAWTGLSFAFPPSR